MRITALYDQAGSILAAVEVTDDYTGPIPVATQEGTKVGTFEVPERLTEQRLDEICNSHRIDAESLVER